MRKQGSNSEPLSDAVGVGRKQGPQPGNVQPTTGTQQPALSAQGHAILLHAPTLPRLNTDTLQTLRMWICHIGWPFPGQREGRRCPGREVGVSTPRSTVGGNGSRQSAWCPTFECSPWLRTVGRKKRDLREEKKATQSQSKARGQHAGGAQEGRACRHLQRSRHHRLSRDILVWEGLSLPFCLLLCDPNPASLVAQLYTLAWLDFLAFPARALTVPDRTFCSPGWSQMMLRMALNS